MRRAKADRLGLLAWYPSTWRERYGDEFNAMIEDTLAGRTPGLRFRLAIVRAGVRERLYGSGITGNTTSAADRVRSGSLLVLCAWSLFVVAGGNFANFADQFRQDLPRRTSALPIAGYDTVFLVAIIGGCLVITGAVVALPSFFRFLAAGGWPPIRRRVVRALMVTTAALISTIALIIYAHTLTPADRNGGLVSHPVVPYFLALFIVTMLLLITMLVLWTSVVVVIARQLSLSPTVLSLEASLATALAAAMIVMTVAEAMWWGAIAATAPWFLQDTRFGSPGSAYNLRLVVSTSLMTLAVAVAAYGVHRVAKSRGQCRFDQSNMTA